MAARKQQERERAIAMRREGASLNEIASATGCAKSTVSLWVRHIQLSDEQISHLAERDRSAMREGHREWSHRHRQARILAQLHGKVLAQTPDPLHIAGCMLYWAEGSKSRNSVIFTNSDADMVRHFLEFLRGCYEVRDAQVALTINCFVDNGLTLDDIEAWWLEKLDLPPTCLRKAAVNKASRASKKVRAPLLYGTARISVSSTFIVQSIYGAIQEYAGCARPEWLDLGVKLPAPCPATA